jgi:hypothetical protein
MPLELQQRLCCQSSEEGVGVMGRLRLRARITMLTGLVGVAICVLPAAANAGTCPNELLRAEQGDLRLPDCRAYELVTPTEKAGTQDLQFAFDTHVAVAPSGERIALLSNAFFGTNPTPAGTRAIFEHAPSGWSMTSIQPPDAGETAYEFNIVNPELTLFGGHAAAAGSSVSLSPFQSFPVGPIGGPYANVARIPFTTSESTDRLEGASSDFSSVVLSSLDHSLLPVAEATVEGAHDLYDWSAATNQLTLVNVTNGGTLTSSCGAALGGVRQTIERAPGSLNAVSSDGSKVFFTSPDGEARSGEASCEEPKRIYMRRNGSETVEVSAPEAGVIDPTGLHSAYYEGATEDGSRVWFITTTELTADDTGEANELYEYNTLTGKLVRVSRGETGTAEGNVEPEELAISGDGSTVYFVAASKLTANAPTPGVGVGNNLYRYDTETGKTVYVATVNIDSNGVNPLDTNRTGSAVVFQAGSATGPGGFQSSEGYDEIYRYSAADERLICVSCPPPGSSANGATFITRGGAGEPVLSFYNRVDQPRIISDDARFVFFSSDDELVPQDTNGEGGREQDTTTDTYEWESDGTGSCQAAEGCLSLLTSGTSEFASTFLGASADGKNVFIGTHSALAPQDPDTMGDVYDVRVNGGFAMPHAVAVCGGESCRLIGNAAPVFGTPQSVAFVGAGNPPHVVARKAKAKKRTHKKHARRHHKRHKHSRRHKVNKEHRSRVAHAGDRHRALGIDGGIR